MTKISWNSAVGLIGLGLISGVVSLYGFSEGQPPPKKIEGSGSDGSRIVLPSRGPAAGSLSFIENRGQFDPDVKFRAQRGNKVLWFTDKGVVFDVIRPANSSHAAATIAPVTSASPPAAPAQKSFPSRARKQAVSVRQLLPVGTSPSAAPAQKFERLVFSERFTNGPEHSQIEASIPHER